MAMNDFDNYADLHEGVTGDTIRAAADDPNQNANVISALSSELGEDEQHVAGDIEGDIEAGTRTNPAQVQQDASQLAQAGYYAVGLLKQFAASVDTFDEGVAELNRRLRSDYATARRWIGQAAAHEDEDPPPESETWNNIRANLEPEYRDLDTALEESAENIAGMFEAGPTDDNVKELILAGLIPMAVAGRHWPDITLTSREKFDAYQAAVENGTLPAIDDMTEAERKAFLAENPGLLEEWMEIDDPDPELQETIIGLALPDVDSGDADTDVQTILDGIDDNATAAEIKDAFANSGEIASGLALLLPWASRNSNVDLNDHDRATNAQAYSQAFGEQTWERRDDIETLLTEGVEREREVTTGGPGGSSTRTTTYMESIFSEAEAEALRSNWAGSYLAASNENIGGGWDALPEDMRYDLSLQQSWTDTGSTPRFNSVAGFLDGAHEDLPAGDGLTLEMANSAAELLETRYGDRDPSPGGTDYGWSNGAHEDLYSSILERASLNPEATTFLLGGDPGYEMDHVPDDFSAADFVTNVYTHPWSDGGEAASSLTDWTIDPPAGHEDLADAAFNGLYDTIAGNQDVYSQLISMQSGPGTGQDLADGDSPPTIGERNPELMRSLALATGTRLDQFDTATSDPSIEEQRIKMFMLINSDLGEGTEDQPDPNSASIKLATSIEAYQQQRILDALDPDHEYPDDDPHQRGTYGDDNGRLFGYNSAALRNAVVVQYGEAVDAAEQVAKNRQMAISILGTAAGGPDPTPLSSITTTLLQETINPADVAIPEAASPNLYGAFAVEAADPTVLETVARAQVLDAMIVHDPSLASDFEDLGVIGDNGKVDLSGVSDEQTTHINDQLKQRMPDAVNEEVDNLLTVRNSIVSNHGLDLPERYRGR
ncbi:hypothetical protein [Aeromicrobium sp. CTD01-1L150]|uniref:TPR repeat region-containing protein n=1 Tax=Aeromicrobium sp. CTD01-1L150 TaxID=3341830 RepID=UPI0035C1187D